MRMLRAAVSALCLAVFALPALAQEGDEVVARVNGTEITRDEVISAIQGLPAEYQQLPVETLWEPMLNQVIDRKLVVAAARAEGMEDSQAYKDQMAELGEQVLQQVYMQDIMSADMSEEELRAAYDTWAADYEASGEGDEIHARHILVVTEDEAAALVERLNDGEDFATLAQEASTGPSGPDGGDLGWFRHDDMVPEFADAAFALDAGEISGPVQSPFGWHVIKVEERRTAPVPSFEEMAPSLQSQLAEQAIYDRIDALRADADIEIVEPQPASD